MTDEIISLVKQQSADLGRIETKVEVANDRLIDLTDRVQSLERTVLRRETIQEGVDGFRQELSTKFMWILGYCTALFGITVALVKAKAL